MYYIYIYIYILYTQIAAPVGRAMRQPEVSAKAVA